MILALPRDHPCRAGGGQGNVTQMSLALPHKGHRGTESFVQVTANLQPPEGQQSLLRCGKNTMNCEKKWGKSLRKPLV